MKFGELAIRNFLAIGEANCNLNDKGLVLIQGDNRDDSSQNSNGAGKSTILDAISWVLYGITARGESGDEVVNRKEAKNTHVQLAIYDDDGQMYLVKRFRKDKTYKNELHLHKLIEGSWESLTGGTTKLTQEKINKLIGCSVDVFCAAVYAGQEQMPDLPGSTDKVLKMLIEEAAGIDRLQRAYKLASSKANDARHACELLDSKLATVHARRTTLKETIDEAKDDRKQWTVDHEAELANAMTSLKEKKEELACQQRLLADHLAIVEKHEDERIAVEGKLSALEEEKAQEASLRKQEATESRALSSLGGELKAAQRQAQWQKEAVAKVEEQIGQPCDECGKVYEEKDMATAKDAASKKLKTRLLELKEKKTAYDRQQGRVSDAQTALSRYVESMTDVSTLIERRDALKRSSDALARQQTLVENQRKALANDVANTRTLRERKNPHDNLLRKTLDDYRVELDKVKDLEVQINEAKDRFAVAQEVVRVFSPAGVRAHILDSVTPLLNVRTAEYLSMMSDGNISAVWSTLTTTTKGELREKFNIAVTSATGGKTFKSLSGGEKRKVRLATFLALQDLMASRATKPIHLFVADEIDAALDVAGLERLMGVLEIKARDKGTVLTVSHNSLSDWISNTVTVVKEGGLSFIEGEALRE